MANAGSIKSSLPKSKQLSTTQNAFVLVTQEKENWKLNGKDNRHKNLKTHYCVLSAWQSCGMIRNVVQTQNTEETHIHHRCILTKNQLQQFLHRLEVQIFRNCAT